MVCAQALKRAQDELEVLRAAKEAAERRAKLLESEVKLLREQLAALQVCRRTVTAVLWPCVILVPRAGACQAENGALKERVAALTAENSELRDTVARLTAELAAAQAALKETQAQLLAALKALAAAKAQLPREVGVWPPSLDLSG